MPTVFLRDKHKKYLSLENNNLKQSNFATELKNFEKGKKTLEKKYFLDNLVSLTSARKKFLIALKSDCFQ